MSRVFIPRLILLVVLLVGTARTLSAGETVNQLTAAESRTGWRLLFDGQSTSSWRNYRGTSVNPGWTIENGALTRVAAGAGDLITVDKYGSFELLLEYRIAPGGNSGVMFHVTEDESQPGLSGPEVQILDNALGKDPQKAGWLYQLYQPQKPGWAIRFENQVGFKGIDVDDATRPAGEWNHLYLRVTPQQGEVCINGVSYYTFVKGSDDWNARVAKSKFAAYPNFAKQDSGFICLQDHGDRVSFRSIKIRELPADGAVADPVDGMLPVRTVPAFPNVTWEGWEPHDPQGRLNPPLRPIQITHAGDGSHRVFIIDQSGMIHFLPDDSQAKQAKLFADLRSRTHPFRIDDEEGLLGFAFHPKYRDNGQFFVYYNPEGKPRMIYLSRFRVSREDPNRADPDSEEVLLEIPQPFSNHNGGPMAFGPDGYLYIGMGDGGGRNDPTRRGQSLDSFMGSVLRIDVDHADPGKKYAVPRDNPFVGREGVLPEIYATGIRNPWRVAFDRQTGSLWLADVGQDLWEEVNIIRKGGNYGWSIREGTYPFGNVPGAAAVETIDPVWEYDHRLGKSITGGHVYRGKEIPEMQGHYLYGDFVTGRLWALQYDEQAGRVIRNMSIPWNRLPVLAFGEDERGESYVTTPSQTGQGIFRIVRAE